MTALNRLEFKKKIENLFFIFENLKFKFEFNAHIFMAKSSYRLNMLNRKDPVVHWLISKWFLMKLIFICIWFGSKAIIQMCLVNDTNIYIDPPAQHITVQLSNTSSLSVQGNFRMQGNSKLYICIDRVESIAFCVYQIFS